MSNANSDKSNGIPIINLGPWLREEEGSYKNTVDAFFSAYNKLGFAVIVNHGIPQSVVHNLFQASKRFHALPLKSKMAIELNQLHRGYIAINTSTDVNATLTKVTKPNQSESFMMMREDRQNSPEVLSDTYLAGPNQWPELPGFRVAVTACHDALRSLGYKLMSIACDAIGANKQEIMPAFDVPTTWLRLLHYPPAPLEREADLYGSAPHTDFGCLTILLQDEVSGLQVMTPEGDWIDVQPQPNAFVVNVGDMLNRWSNGILKSTPHRVINSSGKARFSCPFFFDPNVATDITPLESCIKLNYPAKFSTVNFGQFLRHELESGYEQHKTNPLAGTKDEYP